MEARAKVLGWAWALAVGCLSPSNEARENLAEAKALAVRATLAVDGLESRLLAGQERVHFWEEMRERRQVATEVACRVQEGHAKDMARLSAREQERERRKKRRLALLRSQAAPPSTLGN